MTHAPPQNAASESRTLNSGTPATAEVRPIFDWLTIAAVLSVAAVYVRAIFFTPLEAAQGPTQKIFYIHPQAAFSAYIAIGLAALLSIVYLWLHDERADRLAESSAEVGLVFLTVVLTTGPIWAHRMWGAWWVWWDARLTLTLFLWFIVASYLIMRGAIEDPSMRARFSSVLAILGALLIPFVHLSVYMFNTMHPQPIVAKPSAPSLPSEMLTTFLLSFAAFSLLCIALIRARYRYAVLRDAALAADGGEL
jgi:heme exporter protein C